MEDLHLPAAQAAPAPTQADHHTVDPMMVMVDLKAVTVGPMIADIHMVDPMMVDIHMVDMTGSPLEYHPSITTTRGTQVDITTRMGITTTLRRIIITTRPLCTTQRQSTQHTTPHGGTMTTTHGM